MGIAHLHHPQEAKPKRLEEIALQISNIQRRQNRDKNLVLAASREHYEKNNNRGGGRNNNRGNGGGRNNNRGNGGGGNKQNWSSINNDQGNKRQRYNNNNNNNRNHQGQGGNNFNFDDKPCTLPKHGEHKWKDRSCNYRNNDYNHEQALRMAVRDNVPNWFKKQVERSSEIKSRNGGNSN